VTIFEISSRSSVPLDRIIDAICKFFSVPINAVSPLDHFFDQLPATSSVIFGIEYFDLDEPFKSKLNIMTNTDLSSNSRLAFASFLAQAEQTDVVIPDLTTDTELSEGRFLLMRGDGTFSPAIESVTESGFDVIVGSSILPGNVFFGQQ
jgi:hypothetical protein